MVEVLDAVQCERVVCGRVVCGHGRGSREGGCFEKGRSAPNLGIQLNSTQLSTQGSERLEIEMMVLKWGVGVVELACSHRPCVAPGSAAACTRLEKRRGTVTCTVSSTIFRTALNDAHS